MTEPENPANRPEVPLDGDDLETLAVMLEAGTDDDTPVPPAPGGAVPDRDAGPTPELRHP